jgi:hypothetical protein
VRNSGLEFQNCTIRLDGKFEATASRATLSQQGSRLVELCKRQFSGVPPVPPYISTMHPLSGCSFKRAIRVRKNARPLRRATALARPANSRIDNMEKEMTSIKTIAVAGLLSMMAAVPAFAQEAIQEPGAFAFYYPNLDVLNGGAPTPAYRMEGLPPSVMQSYNERESGIASPNVWQHRRVHHATGTMHDVRRHE